MIDACLSLCLSREHSSVLVGRVVSGHNDSVFGELRTTDDAHCSMMSLPRNVGTQPLLRMSIDDSCLGTTYNISWAHAGRCSGFWSRCHARPLAVATLMMRCPYPDEATSTTVPSMVLKGYSDSRASTVHLLLTDKTSSYIGRRQGPRCNVGRKIDFVTICPQCLSQLMIASHPPGYLRQVIC